MLDMPPRRFNIVNMLHIAGKLVTSVMYLEIFDKTHGNQSLINKPSIYIVDVLSFDIVSDDLVSVVLEASVTISV